MVTTLPWLLAFTWSGEALRPIAPPVAVVGIRPDTLRRDGTGDTYMRHNAPARDFTGKRP